MRNPEGRSRRPAPGETLPSARWREERGMGRAGPFVVCLEKESKRGPHPLHWCSAESTLLGIEPEPRSGG